MSDWLLVHSANYLVVALPLFLAAIVVEALVARSKGEATYTWSDTFVNLGCGLGQQLLGLASVTSGAYPFVYEHRIIDLDPAGPLAWAIALIGLDLLYYAYHRASHRVSFLWAAHVVHHQSEEYNLSVGLRASWFASLFYWVFYLPLAFVGVPPKLYLISLAISLAYQFFLHTRAVGTLGPFGWLFNTPSHHRVHHGFNPAYVDKNFGATWIVWDRLFGTFQPEGEEVEFGVRRSKSYDPLWSNVHPWFDLVRQTLSARRFGDKWKVWLHPPGWQPGDRSEADAAERAKRRARQRHTVQAPAPAIAYVFVQMIAVALGILAMPGVAQRSPLGMLICIQGGALSSLALWQGLLAGRKIALQLEGLRLLGLALAGGVLAALGELPPAVALSLGGYCALSTALCAVLYRELCAARSVVS